LADDTIVAVGNASRTGFPAHAIAVLRGDVDCEGPVVNGTGPVELPDLSVGDGAHVGTEQSKTALFCMGLR